jgi:hypothetical protein
LPYTDCATEESTPVLRITPIEGHAETTVLRLEGRLVGAWVALLNEMCEQHRHDSSNRLVLDLSEVRFVSKEGIDLLRQLQRETVSCICWPPFIEALLQNDANQQQARGML